MRTPLVGLILLLALGALPLEAQRQCRSGIPCGDTCISADKICRLTPADPLFDTTYAFVASPRGRTYYANVRSCPAVRRLAARVYFRTEQEALARGLTRSIQDGC